MLVLIDGKPMFEVEIMDTLTPKDLWLKSIIIKCCQNMQVTVGKSHPISLNDDLILHSLLGSLASSYIKKKVLKGIQGISPLYA